MIIRGEGFAITLKTVIRLLSKLNTYTVYDGTVT